MVCLSVRADVGQGILDICQRNVSRNLKNLMRGDGVEILVRELDWMKPFQTTGIYLKNGS